MSEQIYYVTTVGKPILVMQIFAWGLPQLLAEQVEYAVDYIVKTARACEWR